MTHEMNVMDPTGHTKVSWDPGNPEEVRVARETFEQMKQKGYQAFAVEGKGRREREGEKLREFDPSIEEMLLVPQLVGG